VCVCACLRACVHVCVCVCTCSSWTNLLDARELIRFSDLNATILHTFNATIDSSNVLGCVHLRRATIKHFLAPRYLSHFFATKNPAHASTAAHVHAHDTHVVHTHACTQTFRPCRSSFWDCIGFTNLKI